MNHPAFDLSLDIKELDISRAYREMRLVRVITRRRKCRWDVLDNLQVEGVN